MYWKCDADDISEGLRALREAGTDLRIYVIHLFPYVRYYAYLLYYNGLRLSIPTLSLYLLQYSDFRCLIPIAFHSNLYGHSKSHKPLFYRLKLYGHIRKFFNLYLSLFFPFSICLPLFFRNAFLSPSTFA